MSAEPAVARLQFVLVGTSHPGNIGSAARALKTMGWHRLTLVAPDCDPVCEDAYALSAGAHDLISAAPIHPDLAAAVAECTWVLGSTARTRHVRMPTLQPREAAVKAAQILAAGGQVAVVMGRERTGLTNEELHLCHAAVHIPSDPDFFSLNLAAATQILAYELRLAALLDAEPAPSTERDAPATHAELEGLIGHLDQTLHDIDFHKGRSPETVMQRLRRVFLRAQLDAREVRVLRGVLADAQRMARLAHGRAESGT